MIFREIIWKEEFVEKLETKHGVTVWEVEDVFDSRPHVRLCYPFRHEIWKTTRDDIMPNKNKIIDPLPESFASAFASAEEAGEFWDKHSSEDYAEHFEPVDVEFRIEKSTYEVQVSEDVFECLQKKATLSHQPVRKVLDRILRKELSAV